MPKYSLSLTFHVKTTDPINGPAGLEIPRFFADLAAAARFCVVTIDEALDAAGRQGKAETEFTQLIQRMPDGLRRGFRVGNATTRSRWNPVTKIWDRDDSGLALVFDLDYDIEADVGSNPFGFEVGKLGDSIRKQATFQVAVYLREV